MKRQTTREEYSERIDLVVQYIAEHLDADFNLDQLAEIACFSRFHFQRIYRQILGETALQTIKRMRLHRAAAKLIETEDSIQSIAQESGFNSLEVFSRSFSNAYHQSPSMFRSQRRPPPHLRCGEANQQGAHNMSFDVNINSYDGFKLCGLKHEGDYQQIGNVFERVFAILGAQGLINNETRSIGIYYDDPETVETQNLRSFAGVIVSNDLNTPSELECRSVPAGDGAQLLFKGPYAELETPYRYLYGDWLPSSGREPSDIAVFEEYLNNPRELPPSEWLTKITLPLQA